MGSWIRHIKVKSTQMRPRRIALTPRRNIRVIGRKRVYLFRSRALSKAELANFGKMRLEFSKRHRTPKLLFNFRCLTIEERVFFDARLDTLDFRARLEHTDLLLREMVSARTGRSQGAGTSPGRVALAHGDFYSQNIVIDSYQRRIVLDCSAERGLSYQSVHFDALTLLLHNPDRSEAGFDIGRRYFNGEFDSYFLPRSQPNSKVQSLTDRQRVALAKSWAREFASHSGWDEEDLLENLANLRTRESRS
jgi:hypothetical protein